MNRARFAAKIREDDESLVRVAEAQINQQRLRSLCERFATAVDSGPHLDALHAYRARGSSTLSRELESRDLTEELSCDSSLARWTRAHQWVDAHELREVLSLEGLRAINAVIVGGESLARAEDQGLDGFELLSVGDIPGCLEELRKVFFDPARLAPGGGRRLALGVALYSAFSWIHPYADGNGRTIRLACDALFLDAGLPPMSFVMNVDAFFIGWPELDGVESDRRAEAHLGRAFSAMERTVETLENGKPRK